MTEAAAQGLERCRSFLADKNPSVMQRAGHAIARHFELLEVTPDVGRPLPELSQWRELVISFGDSGYIALYRDEASSDAVHILAFRHHKEAGYQA